MATEKPISKSAKQRASDSEHTEVHAVRKSPMSFYGAGIPGVEPGLLTGKLIVVEGADGSGRSTQIARLVNWLEGRGHATIQVGLKRSNLVSEELDQAKQGNILSHRTLSLFYATDFADQLENTILPALRAGFMVLADRYVYTLMVRDLVRGLELDWLINLYGLAPVPDAVFYLKVSTEKLLQRNFEKKHSLDYWESGMDLGLSQEIFHSFIAYQKLIGKQFQQLQRRFGFQVVNGDRTADAINRELRSKIEGLLYSR